MTEPINLAEALEALGRLSTNLGTPGTGNNNRSIGETVIQALTTSLPGLRSIGIFLFRAW